MRRRKTYLLKILFLVPINLNDFLLPQNELEIFFFIFILRTLFAKLFIHNFGSNFLILRFQKIIIILKYTICIKVFLNSKLVNVTCIEFNKDKQFSCIVSSNQEKRQNIQTYLSIHQFLVYPSYYLSKFILFACVLKQPTRTHVCHPIFRNTKYLKTNISLTS